MPLHNAAASLLVVAMIAFFVYFFVVMVTKGLFAKHFSICAKSRNPGEIELLTLLPYAPAALHCSARPAAEHIYVV